MEIHAEEARRVFEKIAYGVYKMLFAGKEAQRGNILWPNTPQRMQVLREKSPKIYS